MRYPDTTQPVREKTLWHPRCREWWPMCNPLKTWEIELARRLVRFLGVIVVRDCAFEGLPEPQLWAFCVAQAALGHVDEEEVGHRAHLAARPGAATIGLRRYLRARPIADCEATKPMCWVGEPRAIADQVVGPCQVARDVPRTKNGTSLTRQGVASGSSRFARICLEGIFRL